MQPIKVGVVTTSYPLTTGSPSGAFIERFVRALPPSVRATIITPDSADIRSDGGSDRTTVATFRYAPRSWQVLCHSAGGLPANLKRRPWLYFLVPVLLLMMLRACLRARRDTDVYHANWSVNGIIAAIAARLAGKPVLTTLRGSDVNRARESAIYRFVLATCVRLSDRVVAVSEALRSTILALVPQAPPDHVVVVPNGIDDRFFQIERRKIPISPLRLIAVGNLTPNKSVDLILRAAASLPRDKFQLRIVGDGPERLQLVALASALGLDSTVTFLGAAPPDQIPSLLSESDVFLLASLSEGRSNAVMEALAAGMPVVASNIEGIRDVMNHGVHGYLVDPGNVSGFARCLEEFIASPALCLTMGTAARAHVHEQHLTWEATANRYAELYRSLLD